MSDTDIMRDASSRIFLSGILRALWFLREHKPDPCPTPLILPGARALLTGFTRGRPEQSFAIQATAHAGWVLMEGEEGHACMSYECGGQHLYVLSAADKVTVLTRADVVLLTDAEERDTVENMPVR
jgi:hypothetical protein